MVPVFDFNVKYVTKESLYHLWSADWCNAKTSVKEIISLSCFIYPDRISHERILLFDVHLNYWVISPDILTFILLACTFDNMVCSTNYQGSSISLRFSLPLFNLYFSKIFFRREALTNRLWIYNTVNDLLIMNRGSILIVVYLDTGRVMYNMNPNRCVIVI